MTVEHISVSEGRFFLILFNISPVRLNNFPAFWVGYTNSTINLNVMQIAFSKLGYNLLHIHENSILSQESKEEVHRLILMISAIQHKSPYP